MLEIRPNCECCNRDLAPDSDAAYICTYECTFCAECAERMHFVCPNCAGDLVRRPLRPAQQLKKHPASTTRVYKPEGCAAVS